jgi:hypothetical protein
MEAFQLPFQTALFLVAEVVLSYAELHSGSISIHFDQHPRRELWSQNPHLEPPPSLFT